MGSTWNVYILRCSDDTLYTGITKDLSRRLAEHDSGNGSRYTRGRLPVELVYSETVDSHSDALRRETEIKKMPRQEKQRLAESRPPKGDL